MYKRFFFYEDEKELCSQLEQAGDEIREAIREERRIADIDSRSNRCHTTDDDGRAFPDREGSVGRELLEEEWIG